MVPIMKINANSLDIKTSDIRDKSLHPYVSHIFQVYCSRDTGGPILEKTGDEIL